MATILIHNEENTLLESEQEVASYLENQGGSFMSIGILKSCQTVYQKSMI
ncbi:hypothetical protein BsIDN1_24270 [Bacillus safensis]|uniref:Uncharacterized protein n=1 Tax=Bacillus safensis TaxID=561879 RepID=A0A5S9MA21_BACIA|nr:hypothetical protein BsIDN1_24270 [Bacillus safensis]